MSFDAIASPGIARPSEVELLVGPPLHDLGVVLARLDQRRYRLVAQLGDLPLQVDAEQLAEIGVERDELAHRRRRAGSDEYPLHREQLHGRRATRCRAVAVPPA